MKNSWKFSKKREKEGKGHPSKLSFQFHDLSALDKFVFEDVWRKKKERKYKNAFYRGCVSSVEKNSWKFSRKEGEEGKRRCLKMFEDVWRSEKKKKKCKNVFYRDRSIIVAVVPWKICENSRRGGRTRRQGQPVYVHHITQGINREYAHVCG